jgi:condensin complex subunit 2
MKNRSNVQTLESNLASLNMSALDSAFQIDPLFSQMSKKFDEGGARGMLLANLSVGFDGPGVVFDSKEETKDAAAAAVSDLESNPAPAGPTPVAMKPLRSKLAELLNITPIESLQLVPQLDQLRSEYTELKNEGHVVVDTKKKIKK